MKSRLEGDDEDWVAAQALKRYAVFSLHMHSAENTGHPDRIYFIQGGRPLLIEHKRRGEVPTVRQALIHERLRYAGYNVQVCDTREAAIEAVRQAVDAASVPEKGG